jgi:hypothetical protein
MRWDTTSLLHNCAEGCLRDSDKVEAALALFEERAMAHFKEDEHGLLVTYLDEASKIFEFERKGILRHSRTKSPAPEELLNPLHFPLVGYQLALDDYPDLAAHWKRWTTKLRALNPDGKTWDIPEQELRRLWHESKMKPAD